MQIIYKVLLRQRQQNNPFSFQLLGLTFWKEKYFLSLNKEEKPLIVSVWSIYSLCNKKEEHS